MLVRPYTFNARGLHLKRPKSTGFLCTVLASLIIEKPNFTQPLGRFSVPS